MAKNFLAENKTPLITSIILMLFSTALLCFVVTRAEHFPVPYQLAFFAAVIFTLFVNFQREESAAEQARKMILVLLPTALPFAYASVNGIFFLPTLVNIVGLLGLTLFFPLVAFAAFRKLPKSKKVPSRPMPRVFFGTLPTLLSVVAFMLTFLFFGLHGISKQSLVDEPLWIFDRIERYAGNVLSGELKLSRPSDKPGVTVSALATPSLLFFERPSTREEVITPEEFQRLTWALRTPLVIFVALLLPVVFVFLRFTYNDHIALGALASIALSPLLIGMTRVINPDALLWILIPLCLLSFYQAIRSHRRTIIILAGVFLGLALLTKYVANVLLVFFPLMIFLVSIYETADETATATILKRRFLEFGTVVAIAVTVFVALLPSTWAYPLHILKGTLLSEAFEPLWLPYIVVMSIILYDVFVAKKRILPRILVALSTYAHVITRTTLLLTLCLVIITLLTSHLYFAIDYQSILTSPKSAYRDHGFVGLFFSGYYGLLYGMNSFLTLFALFGLVALLKRDWSHIAPPTIIFLTFIPFYYIGGAFGSVAATLRYQIALYPLLAIFAGIGFYILVRGLSLTSRLVTSTLLIIVLGASLIYSQPYYLSYHNAFLPQGHILNIKDMGDGSFQAAEYLNAKENAENLSIWADKSGVCYAFVGSCTTTVDQGRIARENLTFDYFVISRTRENLTTRDARHEIGKKATPETYIDFPSLYDHNLPFEHEIPLETRGTNHIRIFSAEHVEIFTNQTR